MEANAADRGEIAREMRLDPEHFSPQRHPFSATEQALDYQRLLLHILAEAESLGFELGVLVAGHYPLIDHARAAALVFNRREHSRRHGMLAWACVDYLLLRERYEYAGDHAAGWETSHLLALHPDAVDLSRLPPRGEKLVGVGGRLSPYDATAELGRRTIEESAEHIVAEVKHRLQNPGVYRAHGMSLAEGLWKAGQE
jgi:creatinine amidohydrolase/Fe(II)-dependent formamide hydrolase-like protein